MPKETKEAVAYAVDTKLELTNQLIVDRTREYFNKHSIECRAFSIEDLEPFL